MGKGVLYNDLKQIYFSQIIVPEYQVLFYQIKPNKYFLFTNWKFLKKIRKRPKCNFPVLKTKNKNKALFIYNLFKLSISLEQCFGHVVNKSCGKKYVNPSEKSWNKTRNIYFIFFSWYVNHASASIVWKRYVKVKHAFLSM